MIPETSIRHHFSQLPDPRIDRQKRHSLHDIMVITICAVICGADNWVAIELFAKARESWFRKMLALPHGIPSHDTFGRLFAALDPEAFRECFAAWVQAATSELKGEVVAIDGKTLRRSYDAASSKAAIHMVNAWACTTGISLGQLATDQKSNEITAIPQLLKMLALTGCIVTIDAMGCQRDIAKKIIDKDADYILALKANQGTLHRDAKDFFDAALREPEDINLSTDEVVDSGHGRIETRRCFTTGDLQLVTDTQQWAGLRSVAMIESERTVGDKTTFERRYYISSLAGTDAQAISRAIRSHWGVENSLHWVLDVAFREDDSRVRVGHASENLAVVRQVAINLLKQETSVKVGIANKRLNAGWNQDYLRKIVNI